MEAITLDQFGVFVTIVDEGSFAAAARRLNRAQSAITYAIQKLEQQTGVGLFDRSSYRPTLTDAGHALLPRARQIVEDVATFGSLARGLSSGLEAEVCIVADSFAPSDFLVQTLKAFHATFPLTQVRVSRDSIAATIQALNDGWADLALVSDLMPVTTYFIRNLCRVVDLVPVAAPHHPLSRIDTAIAPALLRDHLQIVLSDRSDLRTKRDFGVQAINRWHVTELETKHAMLLAGLGWGSMPQDRVAVDIEAGRLVVLNLTRWEGSDRLPKIPMVVAYRKDKTLGPASRWLVDRLTGNAPMTTGS